MKYITIHLDRLYLGYIADARDYIVEKAKKRKIGLKFHIKPSDRWITVPYEKLDEGEVGSRVFHTKIKGASKTQYRLVSFSVTPDMIKEIEKKKEHEQLSVESVMGTLSLEKLQQMKKEVFK